MIMKRLIPVILLFIGFGIKAQSVDFYASLNHNPVGLKETFELQFHFVNAKPGNNWKIPDLSQFELLSGPNQSTSVQIVNGNMTQEVILSYVLRANSIGNFTIKSASAQLNNKTYKSDPIEVKVVKGKTKSQRQNDPWDPFGSTFPTPSFPTQPTRPKQQHGDAGIRLRAIADRNTVYQGEQITLTYQLLVPSNLGVNDYSLPSGSYDGFWKQDIKIGKQPVKQEKINGIIYRTVIIQKVAIFPQRSGNISVEPCDIQVLVSRGFFNQTQNKINSNALTIHVKALPANAPDSFYGAVGQFKEFTSISDTVLSADDAITYKIKIKGTGNLTLISAPELNLPTDFEVYDPKSSTVSSSSLPIRGSRNFEYLIIPRRGGEFSIESVPFSYFDPAKEKYITLQTSKYHLHISNGSAEKDNNNISGISREEVEMLGNDIRYIKTGYNLLSSQENILFGGNTVWLLIITPFLLFTALLYFKKQRDKRMFDVSGRRMRSAARVAQKRLSKAAKLVNVADSRTFYNELNQSIWGFLADRLNLPVSSLSRDNIKSLLIEQNLDEALIDKLIQLLNTCELALFSPSAGGDHQRKTYVEARKMIGKLSKMLPV